jgi:hypothetical protein
MSRKLALKRLKPSDLSFFQAYLLRFPQAKQKGFNLDQAVIEGQFFPKLSEEIAAMPDERALVALTFYGPGAAPEHLLVRKVLKQQKNWRLNGEAVHNPNDEPTRFDSLAPEDLAVLEFGGIGLPSSVKVVLLAAAEPADAATRAAFLARFPNDRMTVMSEADIEEVLAAAGTPAEHPLREWLDRDLLEEVARGSVEAAKQVLVRRRGRGLSAAELRKAKLAAEAVGAKGEALLDEWLAGGADAEVASHEWVASVNAIAPYDFKVVTTSGAVRHLDAKSTSGPFDTPLHVSMGEMQHAVSSGTPYDLYRLYGVREKRASLRVARDVAPQFVPLLDTLAKLPPGVRADSLSIPPSYFGFGADELVIESGDDS